MIDINDEISLGPAESQSLIPTLKDSPHDLEQYEGARCTLEVLVEPTHTCTCPFGELPQHTSKNFGEYL